MKVLLINPPFSIFKTEPKKCHPPIGLAYLAAHLKGDHDVSVLDAVAEGYKNEADVGEEFLRYGMTFDDIKRKISDAAVDVVGVSSLFSAQSANAYAVCRVAKEASPRVLTVLGGAHPSALPKEALSDKNVDYVVIGEAEVAFKDLLRNISQDKPVREVEGIGFKTGSSLVINPKKNYEKNPDNLLFPLWDIFPLDRYFSINSPHGGPAKKIPFLPVVTSRGCPFECAFCSTYNVWGRNYRPRSSENVLKELEFLKSRFGVREIIFEDDNLTLDAERAMRIFQGMVDRKLNVAWSTPNGIAAQTLTEDILKKMRDSGCYSISLGVESGDKHMLKDVIKKPIDLDEVKNVVFTAKRLGMKTTVFFVVGFPQETLSSLKNTFSFARKLNADNANFFFACPLPGTRLLDMCRAGGLLPGSINYCYLKSDWPCFDTQYMDATEIAGIVCLEKMKLYVISFLKNPARFLCRLWVRFCRDFTILPRIAAYLLRITGLHLRQEKRVPTDRRI